MPLIDREALMADIEATIENSGCVNHEKEILECIEAAPTIDPVRHGRWEMDTDPDDGDCRCSNCHRCIDALHRRNHARLAALGYKLNTFYEFCPSCGCKMGGDAHA